MRSAGEGAAQRNGALDDHTGVHEELEYHAFVDLSHRPEAGIGFDAECDEALTGFRWPAPARRIVARKRGAPGNSEPARRLFVGIAAGDGPVEGGQPSERPEQPRQQADAGSVMFGQNGCQCLQ